MVVIICNMRFRGLKLISGLLISGILGLNLSARDLQIEQALLAGKLRSYTKFRPKRYQIKPIIGQYLAPELYNMLAEVAMYRASCDLDFDLVPVTVLKKVTQTPVSAQFQAVSGSDNSQTPALSSQVQTNSQTPTHLQTPKSVPTPKFLCSCMLWVEPTKLPVKSDQALRQLISPCDYAKMQIFCFLFGKYDCHFENLIVARDTYKLYLIDNESVAVLQQKVTAYSLERELAMSWVPQVSLEKRFLRHAPERTIWRQVWLERSEISAPFSPVITPELHLKIQNLDLDQLISFWPELPSKHFTLAQQQEYSNYQQAFATRTLLRRQLILDYFTQYPEQIRMLSNQPAITPALLAQAKRLDCDIEPFLYLFC